LKDFPHGPAYSTLPLLTGAKGIQNVTLVLITKVISDLVILFKGIMLKKVLNLILRILVFLKK
jgi:hypothetical protein